MNKGDHVSVLDQDLKGIVLSILSSGRVKIICEADGMTWDFHPSELVVTNSTVPEKTVPPPPPIIVDVQKPKIAEMKEVAAELPALSVAFSSKDGGSNYQLQLCNRSGYHILGSVSFRGKNGWENLYSGKLLNGHNAELARYRKGDLNDIGSLLVEAVFFKIASFDRQDPISAELKIRPKKFINSENFKTYQGIEGKAMVLEVKNEIPKSIPQVSVAAPKRAIRKTKAPDYSHFDHDEEVDLHMELLVSDHKRYTPMEMIEIQKQACIDAIEKAMRNPNRLELRIIHGHGKGTLKKVVMEVLKDYGLDHHQDSYLLSGQAVIVAKLR